MAASVNKIFLVGRLGQDPQSIQLGTDCIARFSVATDDGFQGADGQRVDRTTWHSVTCGKQTAQFVLKYLHKGSLVMVEGKALSRKYKAKDGREVTAEYVQAQRVQSLGSHNEQGQGNGQPQSQYQPQQHQQEPVHTAGGGYGDDWKY